METITTVSTTNYYLGTCERCDRPYRVVRGSEEIDPRSLPLFLTIDCPGACGLTLKVERLAAVTTEEICDARCMGATGPNCSCACGGANHGAAWGTMATTYELESAIKTLRARQDRLERQRRQRQEAKADRKKSVFDAWVADGNEDIVAWAKKVELDAYGFLASMVELIIDQTPLSERQAAAVRQNMERDASRKAKQATKKTAPLGKGVIVAGTIISVKGEQDRYSYYDKLVWKMTVECDGYRVWGTVPSILVRNPIKSEQFEALKGQRVRFVAELVASKGGDPSFAIFKRPKDAQII
jgi:hypothetical protein